MEDWRLGGFGLYVHWPFCMAKCPYCDFNSHVTSQVDSARWARAFRAEVARYRAETPGRVLETVFFGGGTPSLMPPDLVADILECVRSRWPMVNDPEITLEANPTSVEAGRFAGYREAGVNRISIGVQALDDDDLRKLGRLHSAAEALAAVETARTIFPRVSFDLIYARQHQTPEGWRDELHRALSLGPDHLSAYQLTIEEGTPFAARKARGRLLGLPDEDRAADMFEITQEMTAHAGLPAYEVSNHARSGHESRHNLIYWRSGDFIGIGPGAHGRISRSDGRWATEAVRVPDAWLDAVEIRGSGEKARARVPPAEEQTERLMMGLRLSEGISSERLGFEIKSSIFNDLIDSGLLETGNGRLRATAAGRMVLNTLIAEISARLPEPEGQKSFVMSIDDSAWQSLSS